MLYHISCRVRNADQGLDAGIHEHADVVIETSGTAWDALCQWLLDESSWLHADQNAIALLTDAMESFDLRIVGWDSHDDGEMKGFSDWETGDIDVDGVTNVVEMNGTKDLSTFEFELVVKPYTPTKEKEPELSQDCLDAAYLMELSERIFLIAVEHGVDQRDYEELREIARRLNGRSA